MKGKLKLKKGKINAKRTKIKTKWACMVYDHFFLGGGFSD
jgi:hypothetical protein